MTSGFPDDFDSADQFDEGNCNVLYQTGASNKMWSDDDANWHQAEKFWRTTPILNLDCCPQPFQALPQHPIRTRLLQWQSAGEILGAELPSDESDYASSEEEEDPSGDEWSDRSNDSDESEEEEDESESESDGDDEGSATLSPGTFAKISGQAKGQNEGSGEDPATGPGKGKRKREGKGKAGGAGGTDDDGDGEDEGDAGRTGGGKRKHQPDELVSRNFTNVSGSTCWFSALLHFFHGIREVYNLVMDEKGMKFIAVTGRSPYEFNSDVMNRTSAQALKVHCERTMQRWKEFMLYIRRHIFGEMDKTGSAIPAARMQSVVVSSRSSRGLCEANDVCRISSPRSLQTMLSPPMIRSGPLELSSAASRMLQTPPRVLMILFSAASQTMMRRMI